MISLGANGGTTGAREFFVWDLNNPNNPQPTAISGVAEAIAFEYTRGVGFIYDPVGDRYLAWHGGKTVYALNPDTWVWSVVPLYSGNTATPTPPNGQGPYPRDSKLYFMPESAIGFK